MARQKTNGWFVFLAFLVFVVLVISLGFGLGWFGTTQQQVIGGTTPSGQPISEGCNQNPSITLALTDSLKPGTSLSGGTNYYRVNDVYVGTTAPTPNAGDKVQILATNTSYIGGIFAPFTAHCGGNLQSGSLYKYANNSVTIKADNGIKVLTDSATGAGTSGNESVQNGSKSWAFTLKGTDKASSGKVIMVLEYCSPANISSATLSENGVNIPAIPVPMGYTREGTNMYTTAFEISPTIGAVSRTLYLNTAVNTATSCYGAVYTTYFGEQAFVDTDGTFKEGAFDSLNSAKYSSGVATDYDFYIEAS